MADFSALIAQIEAYVKQNGNNEITGNGLQDILVAMVGAIGGALNDAVSDLESADTTLTNAIGDEELARQGADNTLGGRITAEEEARAGADTGLQNQINGINGKIPDAASSTNKLADKAFVQGLVDTLTASIAAINDKIPSEASSSNKLADKAFVQALTTALQNALNTLNGKVPAAATSENQLADKAFVTSLTTALQNAINAINTNIGNGFVYAGVATPSGTPVSGKVAYLTAQEGTYTNYGGLVVPAGISVIKYDGTNWSQEQVISMETIYRNPLMGLYDCDTSGSTAAKTVTAVGYVLPTNGGSMKVRMANHTTVDGVTLNINGTGAKDLYYKGKAAGINNTWDDGAVLNVIYDSTNDRYLAYNANAGTGDGVFDVSEYTGDDYATLEDAIAYIPVSEQHGGMMIRFVRSSDNKYVQYFLTKNQWSASEADWQKMNLEEEVSLLEQEVLTNFFSIKENSIDIGKRIDLSGIISDYNNINIAWFNDIKENDVIFYEYNHGMSDVLLISLWNNDTFVKYLYKQETYKTVSKCRYILTAEDISLGNKIAVCFSTLSIYVGFYKYARISEYDLNGIEHDVANLNLNIFPLNVFSMEGKMFNSSGVIINLTNGKTQYTDIIPCNVNDVFCYRGQGIDTARAYYFYKDGVLVNAYEQSKIDNFIDVTIPSEVNGVRFQSCALNNYIPLEVYYKQSIVKQIDEIKEDLDEIHGVIDEIIYASPVSTTSGSHVKTDGTIESYNGTFYSIYNAAVGLRIKINGMDGGTNVSQISLWNNGTFVKSVMNIPWVSGQTINDEYILTDEDFALCDQVFISGYSNQSDKIKVFIQKQYDGNLPEDIKRLQTLAPGIFDKKVLILGHSALVSTSFVNRYFIPLLESQGCVVINKARGGSDWEYTSSFGNGVLEQYNDAIANDFSGQKPDLIIIDSGENLLDDYQLSYDETIALCMNPNRDTDDPNNSRIFNTLMHICTDSPRAIIVMVKNMQCIDQTKEIKYMHEEEAFCDFFSIIFINLYRELNIRQFIEKNSSTRIYTTDGVHAYNEDGAKRWMSIFYSRLCSYFVYEQQ